MKAVLDRFKENKSIIALILGYAGVIIFFNVQQYKSKVFWNDIFLNLNAGIIEFIIFSFLVVWLVDKKQMQREFEYHKDILDMNRNHFSNEAISTLNVITLKKLLLLNSKKLNLTKLYFSNSIFTLNLEESKLMGTVFNNVTLKDSYLKNCDLKGARFINCNLNEICFENVSLKNVHFINTKLVGAKFNVFKFKECKFEKCEMRNVEFNKSDLCKVKFTESNLSHSNFTKVENFNYENIVEASNLNRIKILREVYDRMVVRYPEKFNKNK